VSPKGTIINAETDAHLKNLL